MIFRRLADAVRQENWFSVILEILIVVVGIFIGLQVDDWNEARKDRRDEAAFLLELHEDIMRAEILTGRVLAIRSETADDLATATNIIFGLAPTRALTEAECTAIASAHWLYVGRAALPALNRLQSTRRMGIIRDADLAAALAGLAQRREALNDAVTDIARVVVDPTREFPDLFRLRSTLDPVRNNPNQTERSYVASCRLEDIRANDAALNVIAMNADAFDAFIRDGLAPWASQFEAAHRLLDRDLGIDHDGEENPK